MGRTKPKERVLVTGAEERSVLAACRGLWQAGYGVAAVAARRPAATHWSRHCAARFTLPDPRVDERSFSDGLEKLLEAGSFAALIPGTEAALLAISDRRETLERLTRLGLPPAEAVARSLDKVRLLGDAAAAGLEVPPSAACDTVSDAEAAAAEFGFPVVVKPRASVLRVSGARGDMKQEAIVLVEDRHGLEAALAALGRPATVQRFERDAVPVSCSGVFAGARLLAFSAARAYRTWPVLAGSFAFMETTAPPEGLAERISVLLASTGWQGIFQVDLLELAPSRFAFIDLNPRLYGSLALDVAAGANLPAVWCDWLLGRQPVFGSARPGVRFRWEEGELMYAVASLRQVRIGAAGRALRPYRRTTWAYFRADDPGPLVARGLDLLRRRVRPRPRARP